MSEAQPDRIVTFFKDYPEAFKLYVQVKAFLLSLEGVKQSVTKTQVAFATKRQFTWVWLPQRWVHKRPESSVTISFSLGYKINNKRIAEATSLPSGRWMHHIVMLKNSEFDQTIQGWLKEAYEISKK